MSINRNRLELTVDGRLRWPASHYRKEADRALRLAGMLRMRPWSEGLRFFAAQEIKMARWYRERATEAGWRLP